MAQAQSTVAVVRTEHAIRCTLARETPGNPLDRRTLACLAAVLAAPPTAAGPLLVESAHGHVAFSLGLDLREAAGFTADRAASYSRLGHRAVAALERWPGVTVAWVEGPCFGTALELALACDLIWAGPDASFALPGLALGMVPCFGGLRRLAARCGPAACDELFLRGTTWEALQAHSAGLADRVLAEADEVPGLLAGMAEFTGGAVDAIRALRLERQGRDDPARDAGWFSEGFRSGLCQRRMRRLIAS